MFLIANKHLRRAVVKKNLVCNSLAIMHACKIHAINTLIPKIYNKYFNVIRKNMVN